MPKMTIPGHANAAVISLTCFKQVLSKLFTSLQLFKTWPKCTEIAPHGS